MRWVGVLDIVKADTLTNRSTRKHWTERAEVAASVRHDIARLAHERGNRAPTFSNRVRIRFQLQCRRKAFGTGKATPKLPDVDAGYLLAKWIVDGLVDARVIADDTGEHIASVEHLPPMWAPDETDAVAVEVTSEEPVSSAEAECAVTILRKILAEGDVAVERRADGPLLGFYDSSVDLSDPEADLLEQLGGKP